MIISRHVPPVTQPITVAVEAIKAQSAFVAKRAGTAPSLLMEEEHVAVALCFRPPSPGPPLIPQFVNRIYKNLFNILMVISEQVEQDNQ